VLLAMLEDAARFIGLMEPRRHARGDAPPRRYVAQGKLAVTKQVGSSRFGNSFCLSTATVTHDSVAFGAHKQKINY
jgi:hypothetical protein